MMSNIDKLFCALALSLCFACTDVISEETKVEKPDLDVEVTKTESYAEQIKNGMDKASEYLMESSDDVLEQIKDGADKLNSLKASSKDKAVEVVNSVLDVLPLLEKAGYRTNEFKVEVSLPPVLEVRFSKFLDVPPSEIEVIEKENADNVMFNMIWSVLHTANSVSSKLDTDGFNFEETIVQISIPPRVRLRYVRKGVK